MNLPVVLRIYKEDKLVAVKQFLHEEQIVIGRSGAEVQVELEDAKVSPIHALIEKRGEAFYVADLGSQSGTLLNSHSILDERLSNSDQITVGDHKIEYFLGVPKPKAPPPRVASAEGVQVTQTEGGIVNQQSPQHPTAAQSPSVVAAAENPAPLAPQVVDSAPPARNIDSQAEEQTVTSDSIELPASFVKSKEKPKELPNFFEAVAPVAAAAQFVEAPPAAEPQKIQKEIRPVEGKTLPQQPVVVAQKTAKKSSNVTAHHKKHKTRWDRTFAPPSKNTSVHELVKPSKGTVVEVSVAWQERIINTYHFTEKKVIYAGVEPTVDVFLPIKLNRKRFPLVQIDSSASIFIPQGLESEIAKGNTLIKSAELNQAGRLQNVGQFNKVNLDQGELLKINCSPDVAIIVRYVSHTPRPVPMPLIDLSGTESAIVMFATVASVILALYTYLNPPITIETLRPDAVKATFIVEAPIPKPVPPPPPPAPTPVQVTPPPEPVKVEKQQTQVSQTKVAEKSEKQAQAPNPKPNVQTNKNPGGAASAELKDRNTKRDNQLSGAVRQGGSIKTSTKEGSQAKSQTKDISKSGIFSVFGAGGAKKETDQGYDGAGGLAGLSDSATGAAGSSETREGEGIGGKFKDTGGSGRGKSNVGVAGLSLNSKGRGGGDVGYGQGSLGGKKGLSIEIGGSTAEFTGTVDKEAIRRVIRSHQREISQCYERALNRDPGKAGKIVIKWAAGEQGRVLSAQTTTGTTMDNHEDVSSCILSRLRGWRFPEPPGGESYEVSYPFVFAPST